MNPSSLRRQFNNSVIRRNQVSGPSVTGLQANDPAFEQLRERYRELSGSIVQVNQR